VVNGGKSSGRGEGGGGCERGQVRWGGGGKRGGGREMGGNGAVKVGGVGMGGGSRDAQEGEKRVRKELRDIGEREG